MKELFRFKVLPFLNQNINVSHLALCQNKTEEGVLGSFRRVISDANSFKVHRFLSRVAHPLELSAAMDMFFGTVQYSSR